MVSQQFMQFHTKILCNLCESCMIFSQKDLTNQKKCSIINTFHRKNEKILDERNKMQYNRGRCNFCNMIFEGESRPICGRFGLKNRKEDLYEIKNNKRNCGSSGLLFGHGLQLDALGITIPAQEQRCRRSFRSTLPVETDAQGEAVTDASGNEVLASGATDFMVKEIEFTWGNQNGSSDSSQDATEATDSNGNAVTTAAGGSSNSATPANGNASNGNSASSGNGNTASNGNSEIVTSYAAVTDDSGNKVVDDNGKVGHRSCYHTKQQRPVQWLTRTRIPLLLTPKSWIRSRLTGWI